MFEYDILRVRIEFDCDTSSVSVGVKGLKQLREEKTKMREIEMEEEILMWNSRHL